MIEKRDENPYREMKSLGKLFNYLKNDFKVTRSNFKIKHKIYFKMKN